MSFIELISRHVAYPLWDLKERSVRLDEHRKLQRIQWLDPADIAELQLRRLQAVMEHAYRNVPFYRQNWPRDPLKYPLQSKAELRDFPVVEKHDLREHQSLFVSETVSRSDLIAAKTGGSTGVALEVLFDKRCQQQRNAAAMLSDSWAGWRPGMLKAALWGSPPVASTLRSKLRRYLHDRIFFLDTMNLNDDTMLAFHGELQRRKPRALFGHAHSLYELARFIDDAQLEPITIDAAVSTSMMLLPVHRKVVERVFRTDVTDRYGCEEVGLIASECEEHEGMHLNEAHVVVEFLNEQGEAHEEATPAAVVVSDLNNYGMPLIRYAVGDEAIPSDRRCECGRGLALIEKVVGRTADYLIKSDGSRVSGISMVEKTLTAIPGIEQLQIVQESYADFRLNLVPARDFNEETQHSLVAAVREVFGESAKVAIERLERLPKTARGKSRFAVCLIDEEQA